MEGLALVSLTTISTDEHPDSTVSRAAASVSSMVSSYSWRTCTTRSANQHWLRVRKPFCGVLSALLVTVYLRAGQGKVEEVRGKPLLGLSICSAQAAIVGLGPCDNVLDVGLTCIFEMGSGVGAVD